jgi:hypothetical protein
MSEIERLERDVAATRARLDQTIDAIEDRMSLSGMVDDVMGAVRGTELGSSIVDGASDLIRRNPAPVAVMAVGLGWLLYRVTRERRSSDVLRAEIIEEESIPVLNTGQARIYDPDESPRHPGQDLLESRREMSARA